MLLLDTDALTSRSWFFSNEESSLVETSSIGADDSVDGLLSALTEL
jgi:hypothetical protein